MVASTLLLDLDRDCEELDLEERFGTETKLNREYEVFGNEDLGGFYTNNVQLCGRFTPLHLIPKNFFTKAVLTRGLRIKKYSYRGYKNLSNVLIGRSSTPLGIYNTFNYPQSHHAVLNAFRCNFKHFSHFQDNLLELPNTDLGLNDLRFEDFWTNKPVTVDFGGTLASQASKGLFSTEAVSYEVSPNQLNRPRYANPITLRRSARTSMITFQAYQKVFKLRFDEGRSLVRLTDFANSTFKQPFTTGRRIRYDKTLGKNRSRYLNTSLNVTKLLPIFNNLSGLSNSMNYYFFDFPFLDGVTSDPTRHVWFDIFSKFAQREVGGSSTSKYTIVGVPFFKKNFDFNLKKGRQLADTELYFSRVVTARKSYLPQ